MNVLEEITKAIKILNNVDEYKNGLSDQQSELDSKLSDLYHYIENKNLSAPQCCKIVKEIKKQREARRKVLNDIEILRIYETNINKLTNLDNREILLATVNKREKTLNCDYKNRIYTEEELEELLGVK